MPLVSEIDGAKIVIYYSDHPPPHFHVLRAEYDIQVGIDPVVQLNGRLPAAVWRRIRDWATHYQAELADAWERAGRREPITRIAPS